MKKLALLLLIGTVACTSAGTPTPTTAPFTPPTATLPLPVTLTPIGAGTPFTPTLSAPPTASVPQDVTIPMNDGVSIVATFYPPIAQTAGQKAPGLLLLHMVGGTRADWGAFALTLQKQGFAVLVPDLRGHGASGGPVDWAKGPTDVRNVWDYMVGRSDVDAGRSAIIGASIGANLALIVGANNRDVTTVIALSPGLDYHDLKPLGVLPNFEYRPVLMIASQDDANSYTGTQQLVAATLAGDSLYYSTAGHGLAMFQNPDLTQQILSWLQNYLGVGKG